MYDLIGNSSSVQFYLSRLVLAQFEVNIQAAVQGK